MPPSKNLKKYFGIALLAGGTLATAAGVARDTRDYRASEDGARDVIEAQYHTAQAKWSLALKKEGTSQATVDKAEAAQSKALSAFYDIAQKREENAPLNAAGIAGGIAAATAGGLLVAVDAAKRKNQRLAH